MKFNKNFLISRTKIGWDNPTYFIADIAANHNGKLSKALKKWGFGSKEAARNFCRKHKKS